MKLITKIAGPLSFVVGLILIKVFGNKVAFGFMIIVVVALIAGGAILRELTRNERNKYKSMIKDLLDGATMYDFLMKNPDRLLLMQEWSETQKLNLFEALDADDARRVKLLLEGSQAANNSTQSTS